MAVIEISGVLVSGESLPPPATLDGSVNLAVMEKPSVRTEGDNSAPMSVTMGAPDPIPQFEHELDVVTLTSYSADFYHRIHIIPQSINVGNLVSDQFYTIEVWNAYFDAKVLQDIEANGTGGMVLDGPVPPTIFGGLQNVFYDLTITTQGPPDIQATFGFVWDNEDDNGVLSAVGSRIVAMVYPFEAPATETLEWKTEVMQSNNGLETRVRLRNAPRQGFAMTYPVPYAEMQRAQNRAFGWLARRWAVPLWSEAQQVQGLLPGAEEIMVDTTSFDFRAGSLAYIWVSNTDNGTLDVATVAADRITLARPLERGYERAWLMPVRLGRVLGGFTRATTGYNAGLSVEYQFTDNIDLAPGAAPDQFETEDIYFEVALKPADVTEDNIHTRIDTVDFETGRTQSFSPWLQTHIVRPVQFVAEGHAEIWQLRRWLHRRAGRQRPFWQPSFENDMRSVHTGSVTSGLTVIDDGYKLFASNRSHIAVQLEDGTWHARTLSGMTDHEDGTITLAFTSPMPGFDASQIRLISFVGRKRLDTDRVELQWLPGPVVTCTVPLMEYES